MDDFTKLLDSACIELKPVGKRLVVIKLLHYKNELISEKKTIAFNKLAAQQDMMPAPCLPPL